MEIYKTNNKNIFYTFTQIDNKQIEFDFVLTVKDHFYCDVFVQSKKDLKNKTYTTVQQYNFKQHNFVIPLEELDKFLTIRQIDLIKKKIKMAYTEILKIKFEEITENKMILNDKQLVEYETYRKIIDCI